ncbi:MAG: GGDEF domain-containing protein [Desulfobacterales bacterium]|nr:GGDEF domain-containing protein [Desulfobacterales bacterium]
MTAILPMEKASHLKYFFIIFFSIGALLAGSISVLYNLETKDYLLRMEMDEMAGLRLQEETIRKSLAAVASDLMFLTRQNELLDFLAHGDDSRLAAMAREYQALSGHKGIYDQIRFLDHSGMEMVRVNFNNGAPAIVSKEKLQPKGDRYYFKDTFALDAGDIFVSPFDLNIENGKIETPFKPMIRFGTPVFDGQQQKRGIVILNFMGRHLINAVKRAAGLTLGKIMLVNADGYWLSGPVAGDEWGFMMPERSHRKFSADFASAWESISASREIQISDNDGLFSATTIYPLGSGSQSSTGASRSFGKSHRSMGGRDYYWKVISHIPSRVLNAGTRGLLVNLFLLTAALFSLASIPSWLIAQAMVKRKVHQWQLYQSAHFDRLTALPNRALFLDRLDQVLAQSIRYKRRFALLFIDLDGFKSVNDNLGHEAGDAVLMETAGRFAGVVRGSDTVARLGGDEFTILINAVNSPEDAEIVARKIIGTLATPFEFKGNQAKIGASIGISLYPEQGQDRDTLIKQADNAMYQAKQAGKNDFRFSGN